MPGTRDLVKLEAWVDKRLDANITATERRILINYKEALDDIRVELSKVYEKYAKGGALTHAEMTKYNRLKNLQDQLSGVMGATLSKNGKLVSRLSEVNYEESFFMHGWAIEQNVGVQLRWGLLNEATIEAAVKAPQWRALAEIGLKTLRVDALAKLDRVITQGLIKGLSYPKMARQLKEMVLEPTAANAMRIARTEGHRAAVEGALETYERAREDLDIDVDNIWDATLDGRTRPEHGHLDGQPAVWKEDGPQGPSYYWHAVAPDGESVWTPGPGLSGNASMDINCRCRVRPQIKGYGPKVRRVRDEGVVDYITYDEWAKTHK